MSPRAWLCDSAAPRTRAPARRAPRFYPVRVDHERAAARHAVGAGLLAELARAHGRKRLRFLPTRRPRRAYRARTARCPDIRRSGPRRRRRPAFGQRIQRSPSMIEPADMPANTAPRSAAAWKSSTSRRRAADPCRPRRRRHRRTRDRLPRAPARIWLDCLRPATRASATARCAHPPPVMSAPSAVPKLAIVAAGRADVQHHGLVLARESQASARYGFVPKWRLPNLPAISVVGLRRSNPLLGRFVA